MKKKPVITRNMLKSLIHMHASIMAPNFDLPCAPDESEGEDLFDSHYALQDLVRGFLEAGTAADAANRLRNAADQVDGHEQAVGPNFRRNTTDVAPISLLLHCLSPQRQRPEHRNSSSLSEAPEDKAPSASRRGDLRHQRACGARGRRSISPAGPTSRTTTTEVRRI